MRRRERERRNVINRKLLIKEFSIYFNLDKWFPSREFMSKTPGWPVGRQRQAGRLAGGLVRAALAGKVGR